MLQLEGMDVDTSKDITRTMMMRICDPLHLIVLRGSLQLTKTKLRIENY